MNPYYADDAVTLYLGDCREVLPALALEADCVVADPPYGETSLDWDRWPDGWLDVAATVSQSLWCFGSMRMFLEHGGEFTAAGWKFSQDVIWEKHNGSGFARDRFKRVHESIGHWYQGPWGNVYGDVPRIPSADPSDKRRRTTKANRAAHTGSIAAITFRVDGTRMMRSVIKAQSMQGRAIHPTEKPVPVLRPLIEYACPPGGLVVDMFTGSGAALDAARALGRRAAGFEIREEDAEKAARRLSQATLPLQEAAP